MNPTNCEREYDFALVIGGVAERPRQWRMHCTRLVVMTRHARARRGHPRFNNRDAAPPVRGHDNPDELLRRLRRRVLAEFRHHLLGEKPHRLALPGARSGRSSRGPVISSVPNGPTASRKATSLSRQVFGEP